MTINWINDSPILCFLMMLFNEQNESFYQMLDKVLMSLNGDVCMQIFLFLKFITGCRHNITIWFLKFLILTIRTKQPQTYLDMKRFCCFLFLNTIVYIHSFSLALIWQSGVI